MKRINFKKLLIVGLALIAAYTLIGFFAAPPLVKWLAQKKLSEVLHRPVMIEKIRLNPYALTATIEGFRLGARDGGGDFVTFDRLFANLQGSSLFRRGLVVSELRLAAPHLTIIRLEADRYNFSDLIPAPDATQKTAEHAGGGLPFSVNNIQIADGQVDFLDDYEGLRHEITGITLDLPFISNFAPHVDIFVEPRFAALVNGKPVSLTGRTKPFHSRFDTEVDIDLKDVDVPYYLAYVPQQLNFKVASALLDIKATLRFAVDEAKGASLVLSGESFLKTVAIEDLQGNPLISFERLDAGLAPSELMHRELKLSRLALQRPEAVVERGSDGEINIQRLLLAASGSQPVPSGPQPSPWGLFVEDISINDGRVRLADHFETPPFETTLYPINLTVTGFSNQKDRSAAFNLILTTEADESLALNGEFSIDPVTANGTVSLAGAVPAKYAPYYDDYVRFTVDSGRLDFQTGFQFELQGPVPQLTFSGLSSRLYELKLKRSGEQDAFADIPELIVDRTEMDLVRRSLLIGEIRSEKGRVAVKRLKLGDLDVQQLFQPPEKKLPHGGEDAGSGAPWSVTVEKMVLGQYTVDGEDQTFEEPTRMVLDQAHLEIEQFSTSAHSRASVEFSGRYNQKGSIGIRGQFGIDPPSGDLALTLAGHEPIWFQKYFEDRVQVMATGGRIDAEGNLTFEMNADKGLTLTYRGDATVSDFKSVERAGAEEFVSFKKLAVKDADVSINPTSVTIGEVDLDRFFSRLVLTQDGRFNVQNTIKQPASAAAGESAATAGEPLPVRIARVKLKNGKVKFFDDYVAPGYSTTLGEIHGTLAGLSSDKNAAADIQIKALLDEQAPMAITGKVNPLADDLYADVAIKFDALDLTPLSPYAGKYAGYVIQKGKLSLDLYYLIEDRNLTSKNVVHLDQFNFGRRVESRDATDLPVTLATALLKDRSGKITLDLPVSGRLDDPEFSLGGVILQMIVNLLVKAATSPFALVGAMLGGGEELSQIEFDYGTSLLDEAAAAKVDQVATVLYDRPALKLDISGYVDSQKDREALKAVLFENKLKAQKLKTLAGQGAAAGSLEEIEILPEEYDQYLTAAFQESQIPLPEASTAKAGEENAAAEQEAPPNPLGEMERLLKEGLQVADRDLKGLARDRAMAVKGHLLKTEKVEPERVFLVDPGVMEPPAAEDVKKSRVVLGLK